MESDKTNAYLLPHGIHRMSGSMILIHLWKRSIVSPFSLDFLGDQNQDPCLPSVLPTFLPFVAAPNFRFIVTFMSRVINSRVHSTDNPRGAD